MSEENHDQVFVSNFAKVLAGLFVILALCIAAAVVVDPGDLYQSEVTQQRVAENLAPAAEVATAESAPAEAASADAPADAAAPAEPVAAESAAAEPAAAEQAVAAVDGEKVYQTACAGCHTAGVLGAPKPGETAAWESRLAAAGGVDGLTKSAIAGKAAMPPRGGNPALSDAEIHAAVEFMIK